MKLAVIAAAIALSGCASTDLKSVKESPVVHEFQAKGNHAELAGCMADYLQSHEKYVVRSQKYTVRNYSDKSEIQAYQESIYGGNVYLFTVEVQQVDKETTRATLRRLDAFREFVGEAIKACSRA